MEGDGLGMIETKNQTNGTSRADRAIRHFNLVTTAMMTAMVMIATTFFKIPNAMGYIHLGDGFVLLAAIICLRSTPASLAVSSWASRHLWWLCRLGSWDW